MPPEESDEALMLHYRDGDVRAFEALYERHKGPLFRYFLRQSVQHAVAEELFQEVWTNLIKSRHRYQVRAKFTTLLYRIAQNRLIDYRRSPSANPLHDGNPGNPSVEPASHHPGRRSVCRTSGSAFACAASSPRCLQSKGMHFCSGRKADFAWSKSPRSRVRAPKP